MLARTQRDMSSNTSDDEVFEYTGNGQHVPKDVVSVRFHPSVNEADDMAFYNCSNLREVVLNEGLQTIGRNAFMLCRSLERITFPSTVTEVNEMAFYDCSSLREVVLNEGLQKIREKAFRGCESLQSITIPTTVTDTGISSFGSCTGLKEVVLNEGLEKIEWKAFANCPALESITIPSSVNVINRRAFSECVNLKEVVCSEGLPMIYFDTFGDCPKSERITFPNLSFRLDSIIRAGQVDVQNKIQQCINRSEMIEWERGGTIYIPVEVTRRRKGCELVQQHFSHIVAWIKYYEIKEGTTLFELALWKAKIDQVDDTDPHDRVLAVPMCQGQLRMLSCSIYYKRISNCWPHSN